MTASSQKSKIKLPQQQISEFHNLIADYSTQDLLRGKQTSSKLQIPNSKFQGLVFDVWCLKFASKGGAR